MASLLKFNAELRNIENNLTPKLVRKMTLVAALTIHSKAVRKTRVDTGNARANWNVSPGDADNSVVDITEKIGEGAAAQMAMANQTKLTTLQPYQKATISNNVEYIGTLEDGSPSFGPGDKMLATSVLEFRIEAPALFKLITLTGDRVPGFARNI